MRLILQLSIKMFQIFVCNKCLSEAHEKVNLKVSNTSYFADFFTHSQLSFQMNKVKWSIK